MNYKKDTIKGLYNLINPDKYISSKQPIFKSKWEWRVFDKLDRTPNILKWGYECIEIYYQNPAQGRFTIYYPDIFCIVLDTSGRQKQYLMEIKPHKMTIAPKLPEVPKTKTAQNGIRYKKAMERYRKDCIDYAVNLAKWDAARKWCLSHNIEWVVLDETNTSGMLG